MNMTQKMLMVLGMLILAFSYAPAQLNCDPNAKDLPYNSIDEDCDGLDNLFLLLPPYSYGVEGKEFAVFFPNIMLSQNAAKYRIEVVSPFMGTKDARSWKFVPTAAQTGEHPLTIQVYDGTKLIASASTTMRISPKVSPNTNCTKRTIILGHSLVDQGGSPAYCDSMTKEPGNPTVTYHGTRLSWFNGTTRHEGRGGASWRFFFRDTGSVLVNAAGQLDLKGYYDQVICPGCKPDYMIIQLDVNDFGFSGLINGKILTEIEAFMDAEYAANIKPAIDALRASAPNMKIGICLTPPANARSDASGKTIMNGFFGAGVLGDLWRWQKVIHINRKAYLKYFGGREHENVSLISTNLGVDDIKHFNDLDPIHPYPPIVAGSPNGYNPISNAFYAWLKWQMQTGCASTASCTIDGTIKDLKCDRNNTPNNTADDKFSFSLAVTGKDGGSEFQGTVVQPAAQFSGVFNGNAQNLGPFPANGNVMEINLSSKSTPTCKTKVYVSSAACSNGTIAAADLKLTATIANLNPGPFTNYDITFRLENKSSFPASEVYVQLPKPNTQFAYPGNDPFVASQGTLDWSTSSLWSVGVIPPNSTATIKVTYYRLTGAGQAYNMFAEVYHALQEDPNSTPGNGNGTQAREDDELLLTIGSVSTDEPYSRSHTLHVYPNPVRGKSLQVSVPPHTTVCTLSEITTGRQVQVWQGNDVHTLSDLTLQLDNKLSAGNYVLMAQTPSGTYSAKIIAVE